MKKLFIYLMVGLFSFNVMANTGIKFDTHFSTFKKIEGQLKKTVSGQEILNEIFEQAEDDGLNVSQIGDSKEVMNLFVDYANQNDNLMSIQDGGDEPRFGAIGACIIIAAILYCGAAK